MLILLIIFAILFVTLPACYGLYLTKKWYKKGYDDIMANYEDIKNGVRRVDDPKYAKHLCNENKWYHYGAWDAYCEIKKQPINQRRNKYEKKM